MPQLLLQVPTQNGIRTLHKSKIKNTANIMNSVNYKIKLFEKWSGGIRAAYNNHYIILKFGKILMLLDSKTMQWYPVKYDPNKVTKGAWMI